MNRADADHRLAAVSVPLIVPTVPTVPTQPGERPLHHPAPRQLHEPLTPGGTTDDLDLGSGLGHYQPPVQVTVVVLAVGPDQPQPGAVLGGQLPQPLGG